MDDAIFFADDGILQRMSQEAYADEAALQTLLADHPELLADVQTASDATGRFLLVEREAGVPRKEGGGAWWSLDHLLLDDLAVPTVVEVKRSTNPEIRRAVVGQMLDYAANGIVYWPVADLRARLERRLGGAAEAAGATPRRRGGGGRRGRAAHRGPAYR